MQKFENITQEEWVLCNEYNRNILEEFLHNSPQLSPKTKETYRSNLMVWFNFVRTNLNNKPQYEIKPREYMFFQNELIEMKHSSSDIRNKKFAISSLCNYILLFYSEDFPTYKGSILRGMPIPEKSYVHEKQPPNSEELKHLIDVLTEQEEWQKIAYLKLTFSSGCRRSESVQILKEVANYEPVVKTKIVDGEEKIIRYYRTHKIRTKGRGRTGKIREIVFDQEAMDAIRKWLEVRGEDENPYLFVSRYKGGIKQLSADTLNVWFKEHFAPIVGHRITPHDLRRSKASISVLENGVDIKSVQKLLGHQNSSTTELYIVGNTDDEDLDDLF